MTPHSSVFERRQTWVGALFLGCVDAKNFKNEVC